MKGLKKINRGLLLTLAVAVVVLIYIIVLSIKVENMKDDAERFLNGFLAADAGWKVIPEEYKEDYEGYISEIGPAVRKYFADEGAYDYYIENNIHAQYRMQTFYQAYDASLMQNSGSGYDNGILSVRYMISSSGKTDKNGFQTDMGWNQYAFSLKEGEGGLQIYYLNYGIEGSGY
ncbi:MAG: hypothetical protein ACLSVG_02190 [Clostridia bacterium]